MWNLEHAVNNPAWMFSFLQFRFIRLSDKTRAEKRHQILGSQDFKPNQKVCGDTEWEVRYSNQSAAAFFKKRIHYRTNSSLGLFAKVFNEAADFYGKFNKWKLYDPEGKWSEKFVTIRSCSVARHNRHNGRSWKFSFISCDAEHRSLNLIRRAPHRLCVASLTFNPTHVFF